MKDKVEESKPKRKRKKAEDKPHYVNAREFEDALIQYYKDNKITNYLGEAIQKIANGLSYAPNFMNYCVDEESEALTKRGWMHYSEIKDDDEILSYDQKTKKLVWSKIIDLFVGDYDGLMFKLNLKGLDALVTPGHKFVSVENGLKRIDNFKADEHMILMGSHVDDESLVKTHSDDFVKLVGWSVTEGSYLYGKRTNSIRVFQKEGEKANLIRNVFKNLNLEYKEYNCSSPNIKAFCFKGYYANKVVEVSRNRVLDMKFILELTHEQRMMLIETMIMDDGHNRKNDKNKIRWSYAQKDKSHIDSFITLCTLSGLTTYTNYVKKIFGFTKNRYYVVNIYQDPKLYCRFENVNMHGGRAKAGGNRRNGNVILNKPTVHYKGKIWCPTTEYGTFICRRGQYVHVTGNSFKDDMIGDAVLKMYQAVLYKKFKLNKGFSPFGYFTTIAYHAFICRIKKEKKHHEVVKEFRERHFDDMINEGEDCASHRIYTKPVCIDLQK